MESLKFYIGTKVQCEEYNKQVCDGEKYQEGTSRWADLYECDGYWAILAHDNYSCSLQMVDEIKMKTVN